MPDVTVYTAEGCSLCVRALEVVEEVRAELGFALDVVDIGGRPELEAAYRQLLPAVEVDGELVFTHFVEVDALRTRLDSG